MDAKKDQSLLDSLISDFGRLINDDDADVTVSSEKRHAQIQFAYECMRFLTRGSDTKVALKLYSPLKTMGVVTVEGASINIVETEWFSRAAALASLVEIYPLRNNKVRMEMTFHGLTTPVLGVKT